MLTTRTLATLALATLLSLSMGQFSNAQDDDAALLKAHEQLKAVLDQVDELFYKEMTTDSGVTFYNLIWEMDGETSKITFELRQLGHYSGKPVFGLLAYTTVAQTEGSMPPAVIKAVATKNETTGLGFFSMTSGFDTLYMNFTTPSDALTPAQVWMTCAYMHNNRIKMRKEVETLMSASGR
ncbi:hypothetical protein KOR42_08710 [Thalassoglobus neptunius]|uniref:Uncharacterized protein n=1 Tax=Thalassoglobus neptunius TaxID=1938619 RepID=A0A5C5X3S4_9PLAN|nr:hypothetical protein [Thalassoglobus neptunius]TWT57510.1 hypothetical protein KOR42_08710 [Thalassoglobus neptunius]